MPVPDDRRWARNGDMSMNLTATTRAALLAAAAILPIAGCGQTQQAVTAVQSSAEAQTSPTLSTTDATFLNEAARAGGEEVAAGELAQTKAGSPGVRRFGARMVADHTAANQALGILARSKQITPISDPDDAHTQAMAQLATLRGRAFDRAYMAGQVRDHLSAVTLFENEAQNGTDPDVKAFAQKQLPTLQSHLAMARRLAPTSRTMKPAT
jgi:putative membrane protein